VQIVSIAKAAARNPDARREKPRGSNFTRDIIVRDLRNFASGGAQ